MDNKLETWNQVKQFYKDKFDIEGSMVELATNFDIIKMCATGASNKTIADFLEIDEQLVTNIIDKYLGFVGWEVDLEFSPYKVYKDNNFTSNTNLSEFMEKGLIEYTFKMVSTVVELERLLDEKWI